MRQIAGPDRALATPHPQIDADHQMIALHIGAGGTFVISSFGARYGLQRATCGAMLCGAVVVAAFGYLSTTLAITLTLAFFAGFTTNGGFNAFYALAAALYPTEIRATGIGWAMGIGRIGAVIGPMLGGVLIGQGLGLAGLLAVFALPLLVAGLSALFIRARVVAAAPKTI